jgi:poly-gamma-glutamate synthesis protein (capsule biosynthesis protein)
MNKEINILITGDFCPVGRYESQMTKDPQDVLGDFYEKIQKADAVFTNLECPITDFKTPIAKTGPALKTNIKALDFLSKAYITYVTLANNHILDYGKIGLNDTLNALNERKIKFVGAGINYEEASKPIFIDKNGIKIAILNFAENEWSTTSDNSPGASPINPVKNFKNIQRAKNFADKVIVISHGGHETYQYPSPRMKELFRFYVDSGADAIINHHTHCISGYEVYNGAPIFYSLGNFIFDHKNFRKNNWNEGLAVNLIVSQESLKFDIIHFNQGNQNAVLQLCNEEEIQEREGRIKEINKIVQDDTQLEREFNFWVKSQKKMFNAFIEPRSSRILVALQSRNLFPSFWSKRKKMFLLNLIRCEAHQDVLVSILKDDFGNK